MNTPDCTDSDDLIFISESIAPLAKKTVVIDQVKRLALQRDIDQESLPKKWCDLVQRPKEKMKIKSEAVTYENVEEKDKQGEQTSLLKMNDTACAEGTAQCVEKKKNKVIKEESVVKVHGSREIGGEEKKKKKKKDNGSTKLNGKGKKAKVKKKLPDVQEGTKKKSLEKKSKNKSKNKHENVLDYEKVKKKAKKERAEINVANACPVTANSAVIKKKKKKKEESECKKKRLKDEGTQIQGENVLEQVEAKKVKKEKAEVHYITGSHVTDDSAVIKKKAKKKQEKEKSEHKKKKLKHGGTQIKNENVQMQIEAEKVQKKVKKEQNELPIVSAEDNIKHKAKRKKDTTEQNETNKKLEKEKSERKKKKLKHEGSQIKHENAQVQIEAEKVPKKAKKKQNDLPVVSAEDNYKHKTKRKKDTMEENETKKKKTAKLKLSKREMTQKTPVGQEIDEVKLKKKKKKDNEKSKDSDKEAQKEEKDVKSGAGLEEAETKPKRKKEKPKKRKSTELCAEEETESTKKKKQKVKMPKCEKIDFQEPSKERKRKSSLPKDKHEDVFLQKDKHVEDVFPDSPMKKKNGIKEEIEYEVHVPQVDVVFLSAKTGNADEVTINQERRQALQMEVDKASQPQNMDQLSGFGQWSTAQFESSQQQQRFLRLLGGFKKDLQPAAATSSLKVNMALGKDGQELLQQELMGAFEHAHLRQANFNSRAAGLGFSEPPKKTFFIDVNASKSVRFVD